jgi:uncharacterized protein YceH (UPF0502 family)
MITLTPDEARVFGVLVEKAQTTPDQYPLSPNAMVNGANQKNNRDPVLTMTEDAVHDAAEGLRAKQLAVRVDQIGGRVHKYRHTGTEALHVRTAELVILAELLLRGPQTLGELRGRASRMHPLETLERAAEMIRALIDRPEPFVKEIPPAPGSRAVRYVQLLCPDLHDVEFSSESPAAQPMPSASSGLADRVGKLESEVSMLRGILRRLATSLGDQDLIAELAEQESTQ